MSTPYCGARDTPKGRRPGTFEQCKKSGQLRRYGTFKITELMPNDKRREPIHRKIISSKKKVVFRDRISEPDVLLFDEMGFDLKETPKKKTIKKPINKELIKKVKPIKKDFLDDVIIRHLFPGQLDKIKRKIKRPKNKAEEVIKKPLLIKEIIDQLNHNKMNINHNLTHKLWKRHENKGEDVSGSPFILKYATAEIARNAAKVEIKADMAHNQLILDNLKKKEPIKEVELGERRDQVVNASINKNEIFTEPIKKVKPIKKDFLDDVIIRHLLPGQLDKIKLKIKRPKNKAEEVIKKPLLIEEINDQLHNNKMNIEHNITFKLWKRHVTENEDDVSGRPFILKYATVEIARKAAKVEIIADMAHNQLILDNLKK